jgi:hypothetical protein
VARFLPLPVVDELFRLFEAGYTARRAAAAAGVCRKSATRYRRLWRSRRSPDNAALLIVRVHPRTSAAMASLARARRRSVEQLAGDIIDTVIGENLVAAILWR